MTDPLNDAIDREHTAAVAAAPRCLCGHGRSLHGRSNHSTHATGCYSLACGCTRMRPMEVDQ